jgi:hypothetical protein
MKALLVLFFWLVPGFSAVYGQLEQTARAELPMRADGSAYEVWPQPDSSVLVLRAEPAFRRLAEPFTLFRFGAGLNLVWQTPVKVPPGCHFVNAAFEKQVTFLLFQGNKPTDFHLAMLNSRTGEQTISNHHLPEKMTFAPTDLAVLNGKLFLPGIQNERLLLLHLDPAETGFQKLPALYDQSSNLTEFFADTAAQRMEFVLAESNGKRGRLQIKRLAPDGTLLSLNFIQTQDRNFLAGRLAPGDSTRKRVAGSYSFRDLRYAQGFFVSPLVLQPGEKPQYYDFTTFSHYFDYMKPGRQVRIRQRIARHQLARKAFPVRQRILLHALQPYQDGFLMAGELYYPQYSGDAGNRIFEGFQHTAVIVAAFDQVGNLRWENCFPLQDQRFFKLKEVISVAVFGEQVLMAYPDEAIVKYKVMNSGQKTPNDRFLELKLTAEKILSTEPEGIKPWFGKNILTFGMQQIRGTTGLRDVFYLCKLTAT